ncbi:MAG: DUF423 domain-containing protein [Verrucomicrobia bacterium]|nr:DUF423 domain-containing protein [Verrucomicrobiota bacterium]
MKKWLFFSGLAGFTGVALGAFGAHALKATLAVSGPAAIWETAVLYQLVHAVAALTVSLNAPGRLTVEGKWPARACGCWLLGIVLFSGSLYLLALGGPHWLGPVTPLGGGFLLAGWGCVIVGGFKSPSGVA